MNSGFLSLHYSCAQLSQPTYIVNIHSKAYYTTSMKHEKQYFVKNPSHLLRSPVPYLENPSVSNIHRNQTSKSNTARRLFPTFPPPFHQNKNKNIPWPSQPASKQHTSNQPKPPYLAHMLRPISILPWLIAQVRNTHLEEGEVILFQKEGKERFYGSLSIRRGERGGGGKQRTNNQNSLFWLVCYCTRLCIRHCTYLSRMGGDCDGGGGVLGRAVARRAGLC